MNLSGRYDGFTTIFGFDDQSKFAADTVPDHTKAGKYAAETLRGRSSHPTMSTAGLDGSGTGTTK